LTEFAIRFDLSGSRLILTEFEYANFFPDKMDENRTLPPGSILEDRHEAIALSFLSPWELQGPLRVTRRDDMFHWIEIFARMLLKRQFWEIQSRECQQDDAMCLINFKQFYPYFTHNGPQESRIWNRLRSDQRQEVKQNLNSILDIIRLADMDDEPSYAAIRHHLSRALEIARAASNHK
jgi:hypothetical protein